MPLDQSLVGRVYPPTAPYEVAREKIREFALAIGADDPAYLDSAAARALGHPDVIAPPTFPIVMTLVGEGGIQEDPDLALDFARVVHGDQRFVYARPVRAGDRLVCVKIIEDIMSRAGNDFVTTRAEITTDQGEPVVTVWSKLVVRGEAD